MYVCRALLSALWTRQWDPGFRQSVVCATISKFDSYCMLIWYGREWDVGFRLALHPVMWLQSSLKWSSDHFVYIYIFHFGFYVAPGTWLRPDMCPSAVCGSLYCPCCRLAVSFAVGFVNKAVRSRVPTVSVCVTISKFDLYCMYSEYLPRIFTIS